MKTIIEKTKMYQYDVQYIQNIKQFLAERYMRGDYGESKETIQEFISMLELALSSLKYKEIEVEEKVKESEEEARQYFGEDFISEFEQIRQFCTENNLMLAIHGTNPQTLDLIQNEGLLYKSPAILSTALIQNDTDLEENYTNYRNLLNWPHREYKGLILLGIPSECNGVLFHGEKETKPLWLKTSKAGEYEGQYRINPEFIIGQIDVSKKMIQKNPAFSLNHDYSGLDYDNDLTNYGRKLSIPIETIKGVTEDERQEQYDGLYEEVNESEESSQKSKEELLFDLETEVMPVVAVLIRAKGQMKEKKISKYIEILKQSITTLKHIEPQLKEKQEIKNELEVANKETENSLEWDDLEWDDDEIEQDESTESFIGSFIADVEENIGQNATLSGINQETQYIKSKTRDKSEQEKGITRD